MTEQMELSKEANKKNQGLKFQGPIRFGALIPFVIVCAGVGGYFTLFFDSHLRKALEWGLTKVNGAEVNVAAVHTSFVGGSFKASGIALTDSEEPTQNSFEIGDVSYKFSWDALLRAKFVVVDASIHNIQISTPRKRPGKVIPKEEEKETKAEESKSTFFADAAKMVSGNESLKELTNIPELKSAAKAKELQAQLDGKDKQWKSALEKLPKTAELQSLKERAGKLKIGGTNNPAELQKQLNEANDLVKEASQKMEQVKSVTGPIAKDLDSYGKSIAEIDALVKEDRAMLESKLKLPKLDAESLAAQIFGPGFKSKIMKARYYWNMAQKYMPPKKSKSEREAEVIRPDPRMAGRTFHFPKKSGYPFFWLKHSGISSEASNSPFGGNLKGDLTDVSSSPSMIGKPTVLHVAGDFPAKNMKNVDLKLSLDFTGDTPVALLTASVGQFDVVDRALSDSQSLKLSLKKASAESKFDSRIEGNKVDIKMITVFKESAFDVNSDNKDMKDIVEGALKEASTVTLQAKAVGTFENLNMDIRSSLGEALEKGFEKQLKAKLDEARKKVQAIIDEKIGPQKAQLEKQFNQIKSQIDGQLKEKTGEVDKTKAVAEQKVNETKKQAEKGISEQGQQQIKKAGDDLRKKLGF